nr:hypothetical protein [Solanum melongena]WMB97014.1 hypothetical protein [Solanum aethiopicum]
MKKCTFFFNNATGLISELELLTAALSIRSFSPNSACSSNSYYSIHPVHQVATLDLPSIIATCSYSISLPFQLDLALKLSLRLAFGYGLSSTLIVEKMRMGYGDEWN